MTGEHRNEASAHAAKGATSLCRARLDVLAGESFDTKIRQLASRRCVEHETPDPEAEFVLASIREKR